MGSREDVASKIDVDTKRRIEDMNKAVQSQKQPVSNLQFIIILWLGILKVLKQFGQTNQYNVL